MTHLRAQKSFQALVRRVSREREGVDARVRRGEASDVLGLPGEQEQRLDPDRPEQSDRHARAEDYYETAAQNDADARVVRCTVRLRAQRVHAAEKADDEREAGDVARHEPQRRAAEPRSG